MRTTRDWGDVFGFQVPVVVALIACVVLLIAACLAV
jgi:hypothetical protein